MVISRGTTSYSFAHGQVCASGACICDTELTEAFSNRLPTIIWDSTGASEIRDILSAVATTDFQQRRLEEVLNSQPRPEDWRVGEAIAEAYVTDHYGCRFPWPGGRDLRNPSGSPSGADMVGFHFAPAQSPKFAFGEVKTSAEAKWPPSVLDGRSGLAKQVEGLRDSEHTRACLVRYLGHHAVNAAWQTTYQAAASRYLSDTADVSLFGVLVRDVEPKEDDLRPRVQALATGCPSNTTIYLLAIYLPTKQIAVLSQLAVAAKERELCP